ncbi:MAG TPA: hypothetical protein VF510_18810, partial [Ktedonobacterales bacterium]
LTPYPRSFGQLLGAIIRLYGKHLGIWLVLAFVVALLPRLITNALQLALEMQRGLDPLAGRDVLGDLLNTSGVTTSTPNGAEPPLYTLLTSLISMFELVLGAWTLAALTAGSRDAILGRRVTIKTSVVGGFQRLWKTLGATLLVILLLLGVSLIALVVAFVIDLLFTIVALPLAGPAAASGTEPTPFRIGLAACAMDIAFLPVLALAVRLALAPSLAALGYEDPVRRSLLLTRRQWWRTFGVLLVANVPALLLGLGMLAAEYMSAGLALIVVGPLVQLLAAPLTALAYTALIYDLRLRREGYLVFMQEHLTPPPPETA